MQRIAIIGCGGSGKSTLARRMGATLNIPVRHLDRWYWKAGWIATSDDEWPAVHERLCCEPAWILDGNYGGTMDARLRAADTVIFLDLPRWRCLWGVLNRYWRYRGQVRPDASAGCPERLTVDYINWIWTYRRTRRPRILRTLEHLDADRNVVIFDSHRAVSAFLAGLGDEPADEPQGRTPRAADRACAHPAQPAAWRANR